MKKVMIFILLMAIYAPAVFSEVLYQLNGPKAVCKVNCKFFSQSNCFDTEKRQIAVIDISKQSKVTIEGEIWAEADTCYNPGRLTIRIMDAGGNPVDMEMADSVDCLGTRTPFRWNLSLNGGQALKVQLKSGDWCSSLSRFSVLTK
jgi:hypothetical protein